MTNPAKKKPILKNEGFNYRHPKLVNCTILAISLGIVFGKPLYEFFNDCYNYVKFKRQIKRELDEEFKN